MTSPSYRPKSLRVTSLTINITEFKKGAPLITCQIGTFVPKKRKMVQEQIEATTEHSFRRAYLRVRKHLKELKASGG